MPAKVALGMMKSWKSAAVGKVDCFQLRFLTGPWEGFSCAQSESRITRLVMVAKGGNIKARFFMNANRFQQGSCFTIFRGIAFWLTVAAL